VKRHRTDLIALLFGLAFVAVGASFLANELTDTDLDAAWVSAITFVTLGLIALAGTFLRRPNDLTVIDVHPAEASLESEAATEPEPDYTNEAEQP
jgi:hypothetical protein